MFEQKQYAEVQVIFLSAAGGVRDKMPFLDNQGYRPHFRVNPTSEMFSVEFVDGPDGPAIAGMPIFATIRFCYHPNICYDKLQPGTKFEIIEDNYVVGHGKVTRL